MKNKIVAIILSSLFIINIIPPFAISAYTDKNNKNEISPYPNSNSTILSSGKIKFDNNDLNFGAVEPLSAPTQLNNNVQLVSAAVGNWSDNRDQSLFKSNPDSYSSTTSWTIQTAAQLADLAYVVTKGRNNGAQNSNLFNSGMPTTFYGKTIYIEGNIDLSAHNWDIPIGQIFDNGQGNRVVNAFSGKIIFRLNSKITGLTITERLGISTGLFGATDTGSIENADVSGSIQVSNPQTGDYVAGICAVPNGMFLSNSINNVSINVSGNAEKLRLGGVAAFSTGRIEGCKNTGNISNSINATGSVGGIVGYYNSSIELKNCINSGTITGYNKIFTNIYSYPNTTNFNYSIQKEGVGGIAGFASGNISLCENDGKVLGKSNSQNSGWEVPANEQKPQDENGNILYDPQKSFEANPNGGIGGIVGYSLSGITGCVNEATGVIGSETSVGNIGGITGYSNGFIRSEVKGSNITALTQNKANVSGTTENYDSNSNRSKIGGIVGNYTRSTQQNSQYFTLITNTGNVSGTGEIGGFIGRNASVIGRPNDVTLNFSPPQPSTGTVSGIGEIGGVVGRNMTTIQNFSNGMTVIAVASGSNNMGNIAGVSAGTIQNCQSDKSIKGNGDIGGIVGYSTGIILNCELNAPAVVGGTGNIGGICGQNNGTITYNDYFYNILKKGAGNHGKIIGSGNIGGICGINQGENAKIFNCVNNGNIACDIANHGSNGVVMDNIGGIVGFNLKNVENCKNGIDASTTVKISADYAYQNRVGGISGTSYNGYMLDNINYATVDAYGDVSGVCGVLEQINNAMQSGTIPESSIYYSKENFVANYGKIIGKGSLGGVCGRIFSTSMLKATVMNAVNKGEVDGSNEYARGVGGIAGTNEGGLIQNCFNGLSSSDNIKTVKGTNTGSFPNVGGIAGFSSKGTVKDCVNYFKVYTTNTAGGIVGQTRQDEYQSYNDTPLIIDGCINKGEVSSDGIILGIGGLVGVYDGLKSTLTNSFNDAPVKLTGSGGAGGDYGKCGIGGIVGTANTSGIFNCYNGINGTVSSASLYTFTGGIIGVVGAGGNIDNCYNVASITHGTAAYVGGVAGNNKNGGNMENCYSDSRVLNNSSFAALGNGGGETETIKLLHTGEMTSKLNSRDYPVHAMAKMKNFDFTTKWNLKANIHGDNPTAYYPELSYFKNSIGINSNAKQALSLESIKTKPYYITFFDKQSGKYSIDPPFYQGTDYTYKWAEYNKTIEKPPANPEKASLETENVVTNLALNKKTIDMSPTPFGSGDLTGAVLTDGSIKWPGWSGATSFEVWQFGNKASFTIDLESVQENINEFIYYSLEYPGSSIFPSQSIEVQISDDNLKWTKLTRPSSVGAGVYNESWFGETVYPITIQLESPVKARYVKFTVNNNSAWIYGVEAKVNQALEKSTFKYWSANESGAKEHLFTTPVTADNTLYATYIDQAPANLYIRQIVSKKGGGQFPIDKVPPKAQINVGGKLNTNLMFNSNILGNEYTKYGGFNDSETYIFTPLIPQDFKFIKATYGLTGTDEKKVSTEISSKFNFEDIKNSTGEYSYYITIYLEYDPSNIWAGSEIIVNEFEPIKIK